MQNRLLITGCALALLSSGAFAEEMELTSAMLDKISAGTYVCPPPTPIKLHADNGWGNGADGTNRGSGAGATNTSKLAMINLIGANKINTNPTTSTGR